MALRRPLLVLPTPPPPHLLWLSASLLWEGFVLPLPFGYRVALLNSELSVTMSGVEPPELTSTSIQVQRTKLKTLYIPNILKALRVCTRLPFEAHLAVNCRCSRLTAEKQKKRRV